MKILVTGSKGFLIGKTLIAELKIEDMKIYLNFIGDTDKYLLEKVYQKKNVILFFYLAGVNRPKNEKKNLWKEILDLLLNCQNY